MLCKFEESETEVLVQHYRVVASAVAILVALVFVYRTFATESGGFATIFWATLALSAAAAMAELRTTRFDTANSLVVVTRLRALGRESVQFKMGDLSQLDLDRIGNEKLAVESVSMTFQNGSPMTLARYLVIRNRGAGLSDYLVDWLSTKNIHLPIAVEK